MTNPSFSGSRQAMQEILESFSDPVPEFHPVLTLPIPIPPKFVPPHPGMIGGYVDPRMFHSLENGYGMIPYSHMQPMQIVDPYNQIVGVTDKLHNGSNDHNGAHTNNPPSSSGAKGPSAAAKERRRERNKVLARKTRLKKKAETENLRDQLVSLMAENERLKEMLETKLPPVTVSELLKSDLQLPENIVKMIRQMVINDEKANLSDLALRQRSFIVVNPNATDSPIVYASAGFLKLTGYSREECIGRNCRFLQGPETDKLEVAKMREALQKREDFTAILLNYHKDGTEFWNRVELQHLRNAAGDVCFLVGVQTKMDELSIRVRLARERNQFNLRSRGKQPATAMTINSATSGGEGEDGGGEEDDGSREEGDDGATTNSKNSKSSLPSKRNAAKSSSSSLDTKVSKALTDKDIDYHMDKRIRLSLKLENAEKRSSSQSARSTNSDEHSSGNSPSASDTTSQQARSGGEGDHTTADDLTVNSGGANYFDKQKLSPQKEGRLNKQTDPAD